MTREEILEKSRKENKNQDLETVSLRMRSYLTQRWTVVAVGVTLLILQVITGNIEQFHSVMLMVWALDLGESLYKAVKRKQKKDWLEAAVMLVFLIIEGLEYIHYLFS